MEVSLVGSCVVIALTVWIGFVFIAGFLLGLAYSKSYRDGSEKTGHRKWDSFQYWMSKGCNILMRNLYQYRIEFHGDHVEKEVTSIVNDNTEQVIFAASPHGLFPISCFFHVLTPYLNSPIKWSSLKPFTHYLLFALPFLREFGLWLGLMDSSRENLVNALEGGSIYVSPGGAREMMSTRIETKHRGLLRLAYQQEKKVFPVIHMGQENVFHCYTTPRLDILRRISLDLIGYPLPTFFTVSWAPLTTHIFPALKPSKELYETEDAFIDAYYQKVKSYEKELLETK